MMNTADANVMEERKIPYPPRYWWLTRLAALVPLIVGAVAGVRWWWGDVAERRFANAVAAVHARGEPILMSDYAADEQPLPDAENAAFYLRRAAARIKLSRTQDWAIDNADALPLPDDLFQVLDQALKDHAAVLADIREARRHERADWNIPMRSPGWSVMLPHLNPLRHLAMIERAAALHAVARGDHAAALEHLRDLRAVSRSLQEEQFLITDLVAVGIDAMGTDVVQELLSELTIADEAAPPPAGAASRPTVAGVAAVPARREQVRAVVAELLDERHRHIAVRNAIYGERTAQVDVGDVFAKRTRMVRPAMQLDMVRLIKENEQTLAAAVAPTWPAAQALLSNPQTYDGPRALSRLVSQSVRASLDRAILTQVRRNALARMAATALAIRLYQHDHAGQRPASLEALVPDYLPAVPRDPFAAVDQPIGYVPDGPRPYLYCVGENGRDNSATGWRPDATTTDPFRALDLYLDLVRQPAPRNITEKPEPEPQE